MAPDRAMKSSSRRILAGVLLGAGVCGLFAACSTVPYPPIKNAVLERGDPASGGSGLGSPASALLLALATTSSVGSSAFLDPRIVSS